MLKLVLKVDASKAIARTRAMTARMPEARRAVVVAAARLTLHRALATAPRDTNRYVRGWAQAGNAAGIGVFAVPELNRASNFDKIERRLRAEVDWWTRIVDRYERQGRRDRWASQARRRLDRAKEEYERLFQAEGGAVIAINAYSALGAKRGPRAMYKVYGGDGHIVRVGKHETIVVLHNKEPHSSIVERNTRNFRNAASAVRRSGVAMARSTYFTRALARSGT